jgi:hypothetical protein
MNLLLIPVSWSTYLQVVLMLLIIYYAYIFIKFYFPHYRRKLLNRTIRQSLEKSIPSELMATIETDGPDLQSEEEFEQQLHARQSQQTMDDADLLLSRAKQAIDIAAKRPYSPDRTIQELREIAAEFPALKTSPYLPSIAEVIMLKCEETGTATLSEEEVTAWWDDQ